MYSHSAGDRGQCCRMANPSTETLGAVYRDVLEWSGSLPTWQHEVLRRLLHAKALSDAEVSEIADHAVAEFEQQPATFQRLSLSDFPAVAAGSGRVKLFAMKRLRNVNALREDQELTFGPELTVVYGENASGKSGYSRVLKKVY